MDAAVAPAHKPRPRLPFALPEVSSTFWLYALLGVLAVIHVSMITGRSINWDEFWFYSQVEIVARGEFIQPLQTIHTRLLFWLPGLPGNEVDHVLIARWVMLVCVSVTACGIYAIAEKLSDHRTALLAVAAHLGAGFVLQHGASFRVDPIVTALLTTGLAIAARTRLTLSSILALGAVIGLAGMVTIKFVLWAPAFAGLALWRWQDVDWDWRYPLRWIAAGAAALGFFALLYFWHATGSADQANEVAGGILERTSGKMFGFANSPHLYISAKAVFTALPLVILIALVPWVVLKKLELPWQRKLALLAMWFPVLTPLFYLNSLPYFYPFILPAVSATTVFALPLFVKRYGSHLVAGVIGAAALMVWLTDARGVTERQHVLVDAVHETFDQPVNYIDCCGMIGRFAKVNEFRTQWGVEKYLRTGRPLILEAMREQPVPLLLDNNKEFSRAIFGIDETTFHPQDLAAIKGTYLRFWGDIFVAGREVEGGANERWEVLVPGTYTVKGRLSVDGKAFSDGETIELSRGDVELVNKGSDKANLIWGEGLKRPQAAVPETYWTTW